MFQVRYSFVKEMCFIFTVKFFRYIFDGNLFKVFALSGNINVTLQVWDIGGQQLGGNMLETYLFGAQVFIRKYSVFVIMNCTVVLEFIIFTTR